MALKIPTPQEKTYYFHLANPDVAEVRRVTEIEAAAQDQEKIFFVKFRQGTVGEDTRRDAWTSQRKYKAEDGEIVSVTDSSVSALARLEIGMVLTDTDLRLRDDSMLKFVQTGSIRKVDSEEQFQRWYDTIPTQWANEIYLCMLEVNPSWDPSKRFSKPS